MKLLEIPHDTQEQKDAVPVGEEKLTFSVPTYIKHRWSSFLSFSLMTGQNLEQTSPVVLNNEELSSRSSHRSLSEPQLKTIQKRFGSTSLWSCWCMALVDGGNMFRKTRG